MIQQTEQAQQPAPAPQTSNEIPVGQGIQHDGSVICSDGSVMKPEINW